MMTVLSVIAVTALLWTLGLSCIVYCIDAHYVKELRKLDLLIKDYREGRDHLMRRILSIDEILAAHCSDLDTCERRLIALEVKIKPKPEKPKTRTTKQAKSANNRVKPERKV